MYLALREARLWASGKAPLWRASMLARKTRCIRGLRRGHVSRESSFLEGSKKPTAPRLGNNAGELGLRR